MLLSGDYFQTTFTIQATDGSVLTILRTYENISERIHHYKIIKIIDDALFFESAHLCFSNCFCSCGFHVLRIDLQGLVEADQCIPVLVTLV